MGIAAVEIDSARSRLKPERVEPKTEHPSLGAVVIDWGSTRIKFGAFHLNGKLQQVGITESIEWAESPEILEAPSIPPFRCIKGENLENLLQRVGNQVNEISDELQERYRIPVVFGFTGHTNSLGLVLQRKDGSYERALFLDEPSLNAPSLTEGQRNLLRHHEIDLESKGAKVFSLTKLVTVLNHFDELKGLLFTGDTSRVSLNDIHFTTSQGLLADLFLKTKYPSGLPPADDGAFGRKNMFPDELSEILNGLGVNHHQLNVMKTNASPSFSHPIMERVNDWVGEARSIKELRNQGVIEEDSLAIALSTVGKIVHPSLKLGKQSVSSQEYYTTQRVTGGVIADWLRHICPESKTSYERIKAILTSKLDQPINFCFYFDPDNHDTHEWGSLFYVNGSARRLQPEDLGTLSEEEQQDAALAISLGTLFALRSKIDPSLQQAGRAMPPIEIYGGLGSNGNTCWTNLLHQVFADAPSIHRLDGLDGVNAVAMNLAQRNNIFLTDLGITRTKLPTVQGDRFEEYQKWLEIRETLLKAA